MTVYFEAQMTSGMQIKGEVKHSDNVRKIIEEKDKIVLWKGENYQEYLNKETYKIVHISY